MTGTALSNRTASAAALAVFGQVGADRALTVDAVDGTRAVEPPAVQALWRLYEAHWRRFCGARIDPQFNRLVHPARWTGSAAAADDAVAVIVGTGPSLPALLPALSRRRAHVHLVTSPRGAEALAGAGLTADLVIVEHATALDAHFTTRDRTHRATHGLAAASWVAAEPKTPPALVADVRPDRLFVPDAWPGWGLWPATAVVLASRAGARTIVLAGIDLGRTGEPAAEHAPLADLLAWLAARCGARCVDAGVLGAAKPGWPHGDLDECCAARPVRPLDLVRRPWTSTRDRVAASVMELERSAPVVDLARQARDAALRIRSSPSSADGAPCERGLSALLAWGRTPAHRDTVEGGLGASFLPRLWRTPPDGRLGSGLWRATALAADEIIQQQQALAQALARVGRP